MKDHAKKERWNLFYKIMVGKQMESVGVGGSMVVEVKLEDVLFVIE